MCIPSTAERTKRPTTVSKASHETKSILKPQCWDVI